MRLTEEAGECSPPKTPNVKGPKIMARYSKSEREEALARLRSLLKPGDTVHTVLRHVSRSGMSRRIDLYKLGDGDASFLTGYAAKVLGHSWNHYMGGIVIGGCGMDMGFSLVYDLSYALFPDGFGCIGESQDREHFWRCPSNDHSNGDRDYTPHPGCGKPDKRGHRDHWHREAGYALNHRWL